MESEWMMARARLGQLQREHPEWGSKKLKRETGYSLTWVKKWRKRLSGVEIGDDRAWQSQSRARKRSSKKVSKVVEEKIVAIRDEPPEGLGRIPGPKAILYYLQRDPELRRRKEYLPRSTRTVWEILCRHQRIYRRPPRRHQVEERPEPLAEVQIDFKDISSVPAESEGKQQHGVECFNAVDKGSSILLSAQVRPDYTAVTAIDAVVCLLQLYGCPAAIRFDRDPRFVGAATADGFPSPLMRLLMCLDIEARLCPPHRPDKNPFVERYHRSYQAECLRRYLPETVEQAQAFTLVYQNHYNLKRPNQAISCGNQPPRVAFPTLPPRPPLPDTIDPDRWLTKLDGQLFKRAVNPSGCLQLGKERYYIDHSLKGRSLLLRLDALNQQLLVFLKDNLINRLELKGLHHKTLPFETYLNLLRQEAASQSLTYSQRRYPPSRGLNVGKQQGSRCT
jgi:hypothetical protein